ncbi:MAG: CoA pyrophosphatase [Micropruina sp.]|nr:MAG: CoA pyrophosphatase [Micropruina sp.]
MWSPAGPPPVGPPGRRCDPGVGRTRRSADRVRREDRDPAQACGAGGLPRWRGGTGDPDAVFAALREAEEEVGVEPATVTVLGVLPPAQVRATGFDVTGVVGWWREPVALRPVDVGEVAAVHQLPVAALVDPANRLTWEHPSGFSGPGFVIGDLFIWGFTAHLLDGLLDLAGWAEPWDAARTSSIPRRFLHGRR